MRARLLRSDAGGRRGFLSGPLSARRLSPGLERSPHRQGRIQAHRRTGSTGRESSRRRLWRRRLGAAFAACGLCRARPALLCERLPSSTSGTRRLREHAVSHPEEYDAVCAFHAIEHVADPLGFARDLVKCVRPGGRLCIVVPSRTSPLTEIPNFVLNAPPHHLSWWDEGALRAVADAARSEGGSDRDGALLFRQPNLLDGPLRSQADRRSLFPSALDLVLRARLELARRPRLRRAVPCSGIGKTFGVVPHRPQAIVMAWIAAAVAVFYVAVVGRLGFALFQPGCAFWMTGCP